MGIHTKKDRIIKIMYEQNVLSSGHMPRSYWTAIDTLTNDAHDYGPKDYLIAECDKNGLPYHIVRRHKNGKETIVFKSYE